MGFWKSIECKAKKEHKCIYCDKTIRKGEVYSRESGKHEGEFYDYCLCLRCLWLIRSIEEEYLSDIITALNLNNYDFVCCPACGSYNLQKRF